MCRTRTINTAVQQVKKMRKNSYECRAVLFLRHITAAAIPDAVAVRLRVLAALDDELVTV